MRTRFLIALLLFSAGLRAQIQCWNDSTGLIPLTDLGVGYYEGYQGGLYPGGSNDIPNSHKKKGNNISKLLKPLDSLGNINYEEGQILFLGIGASIASNAFNAFLDTTREENFEGINDCVNSKCICFGGKDLDAMLDTVNTAYWEKVRERMTDRGDTYEQVQVMWLLQQSNGDTTDDFATYFNSVMDKYVRLMQILKDTFPNLKQIFHSGLHYTGYMDPLHERYDAIVEPHGYWGNLVIKELIKRQITGDPELKYTGPDPKVPWMGWGPYFWADGVNMRIYDGLAWTCDQYRTDPTGGGFHLLDTATALGIEADMLQAFFQTNPVAKTWYVDGPLWAGCPEGDTLERLSIPLKDKSILEIYPNPSNSKFAIKLPAQVLNDFDFAVYNQFGQIIFYRSYSNFFDRVITYDLNLPNGIYFIQLSAAAERYAAKLVISN